MHVGHVRLFLRSARNDEVWGGRLSKATTPYDPEQVAVPTWLLVKLKKVRVGGEK